VIRRKARELGLALLIQVRPGQLPVAATGEGVVAVRPGVLQAAAAAERVAAHELYGHALSRARAAFEESLLFRAGTRGANEHEEGRALLVESRAGLFGSERLYELGLRHSAALAVRAGAGVRETVARLTRLGAALEESAEIALRAHRGGGLAREIVYLPAYLEVKEALARDPGLERFLERGRISLDAARKLQEMEATGGTTPSAAE
jgi:hypothetical protein